MRNPFRCVTLLTLLAFTCNSVFAQSTSHFGVEAAVSASVPVGKFAKKGYSDQFLDEQFGNAQIGIGFDIRPIFHINKQASVFLQGGLSLYPRNEKAMEDDLRNGGNPNEVDVAVKT